MTGTTRRPIVALLLVPAAALVAGTLLVLRLWLEPPTVPPYTLAARRDAGEATLRPGDHLHLDFLPGGPVTGAVAARAFLLRGEDVRAWDPPFTVERDGTVRLDGPVSELFRGVPLGPWDIAVAIGRPETLPTAPRDVLGARDAGAGDAAWRLVREHVLLGG